MRLVVAFLVLTVLTALAPHARAAPDKPAPLVIVGELLDKGRRVPPCGRGRFVVMMRYRVIQVVAGAYPEPELWVAQACPDFGAGKDGKPFQVGSTYRLTLVPDRDKYPATPRPRFIARKIEPAPPPAPMPTAEELQTYFRAHKNRMIACVERALKQDPALTTRGPFGFTLVWNGTIKDLKLGFSNEDPALRACVTRALEGPPFPAIPEGQEIRVEYPINTDAAN